MMTLFFVAMWFRPLRHFSWWAPDPRDFIATRLPRPSHGCGSNLIERAHTRDDLLPRAPKNPRVMPPIAILRPAASFPPTLGLVLADAPAATDAIDPALLRIGGAIVLDRVITRVRPQCSGLILATSGDAARLALLKR